MALRVIQLSGVQKLARGLVFFYDLCIVHPLIIRGKINGQATRFYQF